jgi:superfamily II DNA or RNA helicase
LDISVSLQPHFASRTRAKGEQYLDAGRIAVVNREPRLLLAAVSGGAVYHVAIEAVLRDDHLVIQGACSCPYASDQLTPCKHLWGTILLAAESGWPDLPRPVDRDTPVDFRLIGSAALAELVPAAGAQDGPAPTRRMPFLEDLALELDTRATPRDRSSADDRPAELLYVVDLPASQQNRGLVLEVLRRAQKASGEWGRPKRVRLGTLPPGSLSDDDRRTLASLVGAGRPSTTEGWFADNRAGSTSRFLLTDALTTALVPGIAGTGRARLREQRDSADLQPLAWDEGAAWVFEPDVSPSPDGYVVSGRFRRPGGETMPLDEPVLVMAAGFLITRGRIARLELPQNPALVMALRMHGATTVRHKDAADLAHGLARAGVAERFLPADLHVTSIDVSPRPRLTITAAEWGHPRHLDAAVSFDYDGSIVTRDDGPVAFDAARRRLIHRRLGEERDWAARLPADIEPQLTLDGDLVLRVPARRLTPVVETLVADGWHVEAEGRAYRRAGAVRLSVSSGIDWFDLDATVEFEGTAVPIANLLSALRRRESRVVLDDGSVGLLPAEWLARYAPIASTAEVVDGRLRFARQQAALLDTLLEARAGEAEVAVDRGFERVRAELATFSQPVAANPPSTFQGTLRDYQREGLGWFLFLRRFGFGGCLADDMGLGKTVMVLALLTWWREEQALDPAGRRPSLIVVPRSLVHNWKDEAVRFAPGLRVLDYSRADRAAHAEHLDEYDVVITTYGTVRWDVTALQETDFEYVILDEAQAIKNATTISARSVRLLRGRHRLALSGTPIENHLGELWSVFEFLNPGILGRSSVFQRAADTSLPDREGLAVMSRALRPFILRRTKAQVARELPSRTEQTIVCDLSRAEREFYDGLRRHYREGLLERVSRVGLAKSKMQVLEALLRLRQAACHRGLVDSAHRRESSAKFDVLLPRLRELAAEGHKALVFSQFTTLLGLLRERLDSEGIPYDYLDGRTRDRRARVDRFQTDPSCALFLISLKAGGVGLNLTAAEYVFLLDPWWNPAVEAQAIDRTHRIGQTREVFAYRVIAADTVEDKVLRLQESKRALADAVLSADGGGIKGLVKEDLDLLLS